jgi:MYXO-CTERM domain-containing protein
VYEWEETNYNLLNNSSSSDRGNRGGHWNEGFSDDMRSANRYSVEPSNESFVVGFRVASSGVPEPSSALLAVSIFALLATRRRSRR